MVLTLKVIERWFRGAVDSAEMGAKAVCVVIDGKLRQRRITTVSKHVL